MNGRNRANIRIGTHVKIVLKADQPTGKLTEGILNRIEHGIRLYDPCLSCSTHAMGQMPLHVQLFAPDGELLDETKR